jgi:hypothetical protein
MRRRAHHRSPLEIEDGKESPVNSFCLRRWLALVLCGLLADPGIAQSGNPQGPRPTRLVSGIPSANLLLQDLEWLVSDLAGERTTWEETLAPTADVFLMGVDPDRPLGTDIVFDRTGGQRKQFQIPLADLKDFRDENLEPIDIQSRRRQTDYYSLHSDSLNYDGWMRIVDDYASISKLDVDVPAGMPSPQKALDALLGRGNYDAAASVHNDSEGMADRTEAFRELRENMLAGIARRPTETPEAFELRKRLAHHQVQRLERLFVQGQSLVAGWITDAEKGDAHGEALLSGLPGTDLAQAISKFGASASYFGVVPTREDYLVHGRMNLPIDQNLQTQVDEFYELVAPVWKQRIDGDADLSATQKAARHKICDLGLEMLHEGRALAALDACIEITPTEQGTNILLAGIRTADGTKAVEILKLIPDAIGDLALELNIETVGEASLHRFRLTGKPPAALEKFYGKEHEIYVATHRDAVWLAAGEGALDQLKQSLNLVATTRSEPTGDVIIGKARLGPMLTHLDELAVETGFSLEKFLGRPIGPVQSNTGAGSGDGDRKDRKPGQALASVDWRNIALPILRASPQDRFMLSVRQDDGVIHADTHVENGVLKAAGKVIAKVAEERLGG